MASYTLNREDGSFVFQMDEKSRNHSCPQEGERRVAEKDSAYKSIIIFLRGYLPLIRQYLFSQCELMEIERRNLILY